MATTRPLNLVCTGTFMTTRSIDCGSAMHGLVFCPKFGAGPSSESQPLPFSHRNGGRWRAIAVVASLLYLIVCGWCLLSRERRLPVNQWSCRGRMGHILSASRCTAQVRTVNRVSTRALCRIQELLALTPSHHTYKSTTLCPCRRTTCPEAGPIQPNGTY